MEDNSFLKDEVFNRKLAEYRVIVNRIKQKAIAKYGDKAAEWFA